MQTRRDPILPIPGLLAAAALLLRVSSSGAAAGESPLPPNLIVPEVVRPLIDSMLRQSPTFRRQCRRFAEQPNLLVRIRLVDGVRDGVALSLVEQRGAWREAAVWIDLRQPGRYVEAIAHELEHVLEHLDGTDLARLARQRVDGVVDLGGQYETARAQSIGRTVAREALVR